MGPRRGRYKGEGSQGQRRGKIKRLLERAPKPPRQKYVPPPDEACDLPQVFFTYPTGQDDGNRIAIRVKIYRGLIVDFSLNQHTLVDRRWRNVARIDCAGGTIHRHQFDQDGNDLIGHELIKEIPPEDGWDVVHKGYLSALDVMHDEYEDNLRRWRNDAA